MSDRDPLRDHYTRRPEVIVRDKKGGMSIHTDVRVADLALKKWQVIAAIVTLVGGGLTTCAGTAVSVANSMRPKENTARIVAIAKKVDEVQAALKDVKEELQLQGAANATQRIVVIEEQVIYLAGFARAINGGAPRHDFPKPLQDEWWQDVSKVKPVPMKVKTDKVWPKK